jgi:hypothetical protein
VKKEELYSGRIEMPIVQLMERERAMGRVALVGPIPTGVGYAVLLALRHACRMRTI